ncbi:flagellar hook-length control protein FliK [Sphingomonas kyeonggiensis]|uniref:Flagellar hook-length control protein FliK n=1 Tax=Sphingomonas kyeonggiensis TaxID=1268553 RepID=A0A7W7JZB4_9SPHN|nr:flagellar hook-length control protein FliK [Sphingomonas kyeonggiensis]MBB4837846.1 flagellar hook-length control protein FliK [Sphingomonas kyeonggiensis]
MNQFHGDQKLIQLATALPTVTVGPVKPNAALSADMSGFALALGALMPKIAAPVAAPQGKPGEAAVLLPGRQDVAEGGKELPDAVLGLEGRSEEQAGAEADGDDKDASTEDAPPPPFAWFAAAPPPAPAAEPEAQAEVAPAITVEGGGKRRARAEVALPEMPAAETGDASVKTAGAEVPARQVAAPAAPRVPQAKPVAEARPAAPAPRQPGADAVVAAVPAPATAPAVQAARAVPVDPAVEAAMATAVTTTTEDAPANAGPVSQVPLPQAPRELRQAAAEAPVVRITLDKPAVPQTLSIADVTPAQPQGAAIASPSVADQIFAVFDRPRTQGGATAAGDPQSTLSTLAAPTTGTQTTSAVAAAGQAQDAPLDTQHQEWTAKMLDRIEALRDAAPVRETKISLMPEGLGKVDIAIRQDDAGLHVQFSTDTPSARQLIADAQPKLAEIAQERGIRIGSTSVDTNTAGSNGGGTGTNTASSQMNQGQRQDAQPQRNQPSAPLSGQRREASSSTSQDERVA